MSISPKDKEIKVGFYFNGAVHDTCPQEFRKMYFQKTYESKDEIPEHVLGGGKGFTAFDIDLKDVINAIVNRVKDRVIIDTINKIDVNTSTLHSWQNKYEFDKCISTIPAPVFFKMSNTEFTPNLKYKTCVFALAKTEKDIVNDYDFVYFIDDEFKFSRVTNIGDNNRVYEFLTVIPKRHEFMDLAPIDEIEAMMLPKTKYVSMYFQKFGKVLEDENFAGVKNVQFLGRWSQWNGSVLTQHIIEKVLKMVK